MGEKANWVQKSTFPARIVCLTVWLSWEWVVPCAISCRGGWKLNFNRLNGPSFLFLHCFDFVVVLFEASSCKVDRTQWNEYTQTMEMYASTPSSMLWESNLKAVCALSLPLGFRYLLCFGQRIDQSLFFCVCVCVWVTAHPEVLCLCGWLLGGIPYMCTALRQKLEARCVVIPNRFALMYLCVALSNPYHTCLLVSASQQTFRTLLILSAHHIFTWTEHTVSQYTAGVVRTSSVELFDSWSATLTWTAGLKSHHH